MAGTTKYNWYSIIQDCAEMVEGGSDTIAELAEHFGIPRETFYSALRREAGITAKNLHDLPDVAAKLKPEEVARPEPAKKDTEQYVYKFAEDGSRTIERVIELSEDEGQDPLVIMRKMGLDPLKWELITYELRRGASQVTMKLSQGSDENGNKRPEVPHTETNYNVNCKVRVRPIQSGIDQATIRAVFDELEPPELEPVAYKTGHSGLMLEVGMYDAHLGKLADAEETGETYYNLEIADEMIRGATTDLVARVDEYGLQLEKITFPIGQDFFHIDNPAETTTKGTRVDTDGRWQKIYDTGVRALIWTIESLRRLAPVHALYVPGNHDQALSFFAALHMAAYFRDTEGVTVETAPTPRKYMRYGVNLIGFAHGKEGKRIEKLMQVEAAEDWGKTKYREFHLADLHHEIVWESGGIIFRRISGMTASDAWHTEKGYKGAVRKAQSFVWDKERGLRAVLNVVV